MNPGLMRSLVLAALVLVLVIITTSAYIRLSQTGLGCADWPACYGRAAGLVAVLGSATPAIQSYEGP